ncbi:primosomal protein N' [candidate division KSB1 bacterium]
MNTTKIKRSKEIYVSVAFPIPVETEFAYRVPDSLTNSVTVGKIVSAPFRRGLKTGFITDIFFKKPKFKVKDIEDILFDKPVISSELLELGRWMSKYYFTSLGDILRVMLPVKLSRESTDLIIPKTDRSVKDEDTLNEFEKKLLNLIRSRPKTTPAALKKHIGRRDLYHTLDKLKKTGMIEIQTVIRKKEVKPKTQLTYRLSVSLSDKKIIEVFSRAPVQGKVYEYIRKHRQVSRLKLLKIFPGRESIPETLIQKGLIEKFETEVQRDYMESPVEDSIKLPELKQGQKSVIDSIKKSGFLTKFSVNLIHGITGSGKTRVYLDLIRTALEHNRGALFLVPEIALTDYFLSDLKKLFGKDIAVLHSRMSDGERYDSWRKILSGEKKLVIGPRSAVFAPVENLGLIIVDEEHDSSYKQHESSPYYHARNVAVFRGKITDSTVVLGSATPGMESYNNALEGKYRLLELPDRIDNTPLPEVSLIDLKSENEEYKKKEDFLFTEQFVEEVNRRLKKDEQVLIMQNRRGFSTYILCRDCGYISECENCKITLTFHKKMKKLVCHFCGYTAKAPVECPDCQGTNLKYGGIGTQQIEEQMEKYFPGFRTIRMDLDTTRTKSAHKKITGNFERGESDILVGTQMIAKGFDFGRVNFVGVISADTGLHLPDYSSAEKTFQLLTQAAGRAGRRQERGLVMIQTYMPDHYSLTTAQGHDFKKFYKIEAEKREKLNYPPFGRIILLRFSGEKESRVADIAEKTGSALQKAGYGKYLLGPAPAPIEKIKKMYRWQIFLKSSKKEDKNGRQIRNAVLKARETYEKFNKDKSVAFTVDVDPVNVL